MYAKVFTRMFDNGKIDLVLLKTKGGIMWYAIVFNGMGVNIFTSPDFSTSQQAVFWAESCLKGFTDRRYQIFKR